MIKNHKEQVIKEVEILDDVVCNCCGKSIKHGNEIHEGYPDNLYMEYVSITNQFGYFSEEFEDGETHEFEVCEECYANWIKTFKHPPVRKSSWSKGGIE